MNGDEQKDSCVTSLRYQIGTFFSIFLSASYILYHIGSVATQLAYHFDFSPVSWVLRFAYI